MYALREESGTLAPESMDHNKVMKPLIRSVLPAAIGHCDRCLSLKQIPIVTHSNTVCFNNFHLD